MINLLSQCMFEATRVAPFANAASAEDWRLRTAETGAAETSAGEPAKNGSVPDMWRDGSAGRGWRWRGWRWWGGR